MLELDDFDFAHLSCGHYAPTAMDSGMNRDVRESEVVCLDCKAEKDYLTVTIHGPKRHKGPIDECQDCSTWLQTHKIYISRHIPRT